MRSLLMATASAPFPTRWTLADLLLHLGGIAAERVRLWPAPGTATEEDVLRIQREEDRLCELVDGVLVEKVMGFHESRLAGWIIYLLHVYLETNDLGEVTAPDGTMRLMPGLVRIPDVSFVSHQRLAECPNAKEPIPELAPDLAVEVLSAGNTPGEMERKLKEYFFSGAKLVWLVDPRRRTVQVSTAPDQSVLLTEDQELTGDPVLPGFRVPVARIFAKMKGQEPPKRSRRRKKS
jgi:Uma2 family endonuclease